MQVSGYSKLDRYEVYRKAKYRYDKVLRESQNGGTPLFRPKTWQQKYRTLNKIGKKQNWFRKGDNDTVMFVECTPNSILQKEISKIVKKANLKVKVVERSGIKFKQLLCKTDPFGKNVCWDINCELCKITPGICKKRAVYCIERGDCKGNYNHR